MNSIIRTLSILLIVQLAVVGFFQFSRDSLASFDEQTQLVTLPAGTIDKITVAGPEEAKVSLVKVDGKWTLPELFDFPADDSRVSKVFEDLSELKRGWPTGSTAIAAKQFKVSDTDFERRIAFASGEKEGGTLFLGKSPGFKSVYARVNDESNTFTVPFNTHQVGIKPQDWMNRSFAKRNKEDITRIVFNDIELVREEAGFKLQSIPDDKEQDNKQVNLFVSQLTGIIFTEVLANETKESHNLATPKVEFVIEKGDSSESFALSLPAAEKEEEISHGILKISSSPYVLKIAKTLPEQLASKQLAELLQEKMIAEEQAEASEAVVNNEDSLALQESTTEKVTQNTN